MTTYCANGNKALVIAPSLIDDLLMNEKWYEKAKRLLRKNKITLEKVGARLGVNKSAISLKLTNQRPTTVEEAKAIELFRQFTKIQKGKTASK